jgi:mRNA interferase HigB
MHVISRKQMKAFIKQHPDSESSLNTWYRLVKKNQFANFQELHDTFGRKVDKVGDLVVFDITGNKYRLIASIHFNRQKLFIRHLLTHAEYDREAWKE